MRLCLSAAVLVSCAYIGSAAAAEITNIASSAEEWKSFGFKLSAGYGFSYKWASIGRESLPQLQNATTAGDLLNHYKVPVGQSLSRTETVPDLLYTQRRHTLSVKAEIGIIQALQLGVELPIVLQDVRQYDLDPNAGWNRCNLGAWGCVASSSSTYLDGIYPVEAADQSSSVFFRPPFRGGGGLDAFDTFNLSLTGSPIYQRRDSTKPTWVIGFEAQISFGTIMEYDTTQLRLPGTRLAMQSSLNSPDPQRGWNGVSEGLHRFIFRTALSHRFRYLDPYFGLWYMVPVPRTSAESPWKYDYGFQQKQKQPQHQAGVNFGFEIVPWENKARGHRLSIDFRGAVDVHFLGRGYSEAWELLAASSALVCDDETALPPDFNFKDSQPRPGVKNITQGTFNPACRAPLTENIAGDTRARLKASNNYYLNPFTGLTTIDNYISFNAELGLIVKLYRHLRLRLSAAYLRDQGHLITMDDAGSLGYPDNNRNAINGKVCNAGRIDLSCPSDWNPAYRAVINQPGRRYRVDDVHQVNAGAMIQFYY